jgi:hypothetical protein
VAASKYRPSGVSVSPSSEATPRAAAEADVACAGIVATVTGASAEPVRSTSMDPPLATKAHRPSGVTATPNGSPETGAIAVLTRVSSGDFAVAVLHPGESRARPGTVSEAGAVGRVWLACGGAGPEVQPAHPMITPAAAPATAARARMPECYAAGPFGRIKI